MEEIEIHLYARGGRPTTAEARAVDVIRSRLGMFTKHLRRVGTRLDQVVNARGKLDQVCRVEVALVKVLDAPKLCVEGRASTAQEAADLAADAVEGAVRREVEAAQRRALRNRKHKATRERAERAARAKARLAGAPRLLAVRRAAAEGGGIEETEVETEIATSSTQPGLEELEPSEAAREASEEEAKARRHSTPRRVKTAHPQRGRHIHKTQRQARATSAREVSATRPTRKSTRKSANRSKRDSNQARRTEREVRSSGAAAARSAARTQRGAGRPIATRP
jgi:hypothetical protein